LWHFFKSRLQQQQQHICSTFAAHLKHICSTSRNQTRSQSSFSIRVGANGSATNRSATQRSHRNVATLTKHFSNEGAAFLGSDACGQLQLIPLAKINAPTASRNLAGLSCSLVPHSTSVRGMPTATRNMPRYAASVHAARSAGAAAAVPAISLLRSVLLTCSSRGIPRNP
jgi:hypothetical protein